MKSLKQHYHWVIAVIIFLVMLIFGGFFNAFGVFTIPVTEELHISRTTFSLSMLGRGMGSFLSTIATGVLFRRFGFRKCLITSLLLACAALAVLGSAQNTVTLILAQCVAGLAFGTCTTSGAVFLIKSWFIKHQGLVLGIVTMATGFGGSLMSVVLNKIILISSWRYACYFGALLMGILIPVCLCTKNTPSQMGLTRYGEGSHTKKISRKPANTDWPGHDLKEITKEPQFYLMILCAFVLSTGLYIGLNTLIPHFQDKGHSPTDAAAFYSILMLALSFTKLAGGWLADRIGAKLLTLLCCACAGIGQFILASCSNALLNYIALFLFAVGLLGTTILIPLLTTPLFGYRAFGTVNGIFMAMLSFGSMIATPVADFFYDRVGSYTGVYTVAALSELALVGLFGLLFLLCEREKKRFLQTQN